MARLRLSNKPVPGFDVPDGADYREVSRIQDAALKALEERSAEIPDGTVIGGLVRFAVADGYAIYLVVSDLPITLAHVPYGDAWHAPAPLIRGLDRPDILEQLARQRSRARSRAREQDFYDGLKTGEIVHYCHDMFGRFTRCEAIQGVNPRTGKIGMILKPIALVGDWKKIYDLPKRDRDGSIHLGIHAESIRDGRTLTPHESSIYESPNCGGKESLPDPSGMPPIDLSVPDMSPEEAETASLWRTISEAKDVLNKAQKPGVAIRECMAVLVRAL